MATTSGPPYPIPFPDKVKVKGGGGSEASFGPPSKDIASASFSASSPSSSTSSSSNDSLSGSPPPPPVVHQQQPPATARAKSSAAKRANAKAAAATKRAAAAARDEEANADASTGRRQANDSARSTAASSPTPGPDAKGDWVVPQRAKPGRKPSQEEPLTKRQAQNRASQRAFRERKQSHVATLEAKVAAYEEEKLTRDAREEKANKKLKMDNAALREENASLQARLRELERTVQSLRNNPVPPSATSSLISEAPRPCGSSTCYEVGCRAPVHEGPPAQRLKRPLPSRSGSSNQAVYSSAIAHQPTQLASPLTKDIDNTSRFGAMTIANSRPSATSALLRPPPPQTISLWPATEAPTPSPSDTRPNIPTPLQKDRETSPGLLASSSMDMDRDCGFCTDATPCVCRGEAILDLTGMDGGDDEPSTTSLDKSWLDGVDQMVKIEEEDEEIGAGAFTLSAFTGAKSPYKADQRKQGSSSNPETINLSAAQDLPPIRPAVSISSLLSSRPRVPMGNKLWNTTNVAVSSASVPTLAQPAQASTSPKRKGKLWWTAPASAQTVTTSSMISFVPAAGGGRPASRGKEETLADALCSGDPSNCPACGTDPVLAAFCEAVADDAADSEAESFSSLGPSVSISRRGSVTGKADPEGPVDEDTPMRGNGEDRILPTSRYPAATLSAGSPNLRTSAAGPFSLPYRHASSTSTIPTLASLERHGYSIPDAFKQIRSHPAFPRWQGGLNLLADVVSGRAPPQQHQQQQQHQQHHQQQLHQQQQQHQTLGSGSPPAYSTARKGLVRRSTGPGPLLSSSSSSEEEEEEEERERRARHPSVEIGPSRERKTALLESVDRVVMDDVQVTGNASASASGENRNVERSSSLVTPPSLSRASRSNEERRVPASNLNLNLNLSGNGTSHALEHAPGVGSAAGGSGGGGSGVAQSSHKRRRLYLENDRVEEALRMLDCGVLSTPPLPPLPRNVERPSASSTAASSAAGGAAAAAGGGAADCCPNEMEDIGRAKKEREGEGGSGTGRGEREGEGKVMTCGECPCPCPWARP